MKGGEGGGVAAGGPSNGINPRGCMGSEKG